MGSQKCRIAGKSQSVIMINLIIFTRTRTPAHSCGQEVERLLLHAASSTARPLMKRWRATCSCSSRSASTRYASTRKSSHEGSTTTAIA
jgi:hypothetical protein